jgi:hypothetical protein
MRGVINESAENVYQCRRALASVFAGTRVNFLRGNCMYKLQIGWGNSFVFETAMDAVKVLEALEKAITVDSTYINDKGSFWYMTEQKAMLQVEKLQTRLYVSLEDLQRHIGEPTSEE